MRRLKNQWGDRNPATGKLTADQLQYRADVKLMLIGVAAVSFIIAMEILCFQ